MNLRTSHNGFEWLCVDDDTYDGPGSLIGSGPTEQAAKDDFAERWLPLALRAGDRKDMQRTWTSQVLRREPLAPMGCYGERETSAGLTHVQRIMRKIRITLLHEDELDPTAVY